MPPSTEALLETDYRGLNILLAVVRNTAATSRSHENFVQQWDFSSGKINNHHMIHKNTEPDVHACFFPPLVSLNVESAQFFLELLRHSINV